MIILINSDNLLSFIKENEDAMGSAAYPLIKKYLDKLIEAKINCQISSDEIIINPDGSIKK